MQTRAEPPTTSDEHLGAFLQALFDSDDLIEFRYIRPGDPKTHQDWVRVCEHGSLWNVSKQRNAAGYGVYVGANPRKREAGTSRDVGLARSLCVDFDTSLPLEALHQRCDDASLPAPTTIVWTGGGFHFWWRLAEPLTDLKDYTRLQKGLIAAVQSDPSIHDAPRIMRVPGFRNTKSERNGVLVELIEVEPERVYSLEEFPQVEDIPRANGRPQSAQQNGRILSGGRNNHLTSLAGTMQRRGMAVESIEAALISENTARCDPPLPDRGLHRRD